MRTLYTLILVLSIGFGGLIWQMSGVATVIQPNPVSDLQSPGAVEQQANDSVVNQKEGFEGGASSSGGEGDIIGLIISGGQAGADLLALLALLPFELRNMGLPWWAAYPLGLAGQLIGSFGFIQFVVNRRWA